MAAQILDPRINSQIPKTVICRFVKKEIYDQTPEEALEIHNVLARVYRFVTESFICFKSNSRLIRSSIHYIYK